MSRRLLVHRGLAYLRNYGIRATLERMSAEIANGLRRKRARSRFYDQAFDEDQLEAHLQDPRIRLVVFDIFDTLISRPLIDPESTKRAVAARLGRPGFVARRHAAEVSLRARSERDPGLPEILAEYVQLYGEEDGEATTLVAAEEAVELALARPRPFSVGLLQRARRAGKRVALASDMFLSAAQVRRMLVQCGIEDFDALYLSSEIGVRKSSGALYRYLLQAERLRPGEVLMIGDHPVSDQQIPAELGLAVVGIESPRALVAQAPRFGPWQALALQADLGTELWIGLIAQRFFGAINGEAPLDAAALTQGGRANIGYGVLGPLLVAFSEWVQARACAEGTERLYFLAREGQLMKAVFDTLYGGKPGMPSSHYLVVSRRAISVPLIHDRDDILAIARTTYLPNALSELIFRRYGVWLDDKRLADMEALGLWPRGQPAQVSGGDIRPLLPVLDALAEEIFALARDEEAAMLHYLQSMELADPGRVAVVDVGYSGSIQGGLCEMLGRAVHGYYMVTRAAARGVADRFGVSLQACFGQELDRDEACALLRYNVPLEMLMGSDDAQIRRYRWVDEKAVEELQELSSDELASIPMRRELRAGAIQFARDYRVLRDAGLGPLRVDPTLAERFFAEFWEGAAESERRAIYAIATDDHYCGMGIVHFATFLPH